MALQTGDKERFGGDYITFHAESLGGTMRIVVRGHELLDGPVDNVLICEA